jgi:predicted MPP superfamily phosphohydrolase
MKTPTDETMTRRQFLRRLGCWLAPMLLPGSVGYSLLEARWLRVQPVTIPLPLLPGHFGQLRIVQLTDIHHGPYLDLARVEHAVDLANSLSPDVIALTGDYVHRSPKFIRPCFQALARLRAPLGVFGVLGNHDHWEDAALTRAEMRRAGIMELTNTGTWVERNGERLYFAGVGDLWEDTQDLPRALSVVPPNGCAILLSHNPDYFPEAAKDWRVQLMLAGHTHGGQVVLPFIGPPVVPSRFGRKYASGLVTEHNQRIYISRGVGTVTPPIRFNCPAEVTLITLVGGSMV